VAGAEDDVKMPLMEHLTELRTRLLYSMVGFIVAFVLCFTFLYKPVFQILKAPLEAACMAQGKACPVIFTSLVEPFFVQVKIGAFGALCITFPLIAAQIYKFIAPGLYKKERSALVPFLIATPIMFAVGAMFLYFVLLPMALRFFTSYQQYVGIEFLPKVGEYIDFVMKLTFAFGFCFELPVVLTLLAKVGIISSQTLREKRRYAIIIVVVVAAIFTPPDVFSMCSLAVPMIGLYEISIWLARWIEKKRVEEDAATESSTEVTPAS
jgi:sec-independent protein translocase protein TatC